MGKQNVRLWVNLYLCWMSIQIRAVADKSRAVIQMQENIMGNPRKALLRFIALGLLLFCITTVAPAQTAEQIAEKALAATVYLEMENRDGKQLRAGSGFFVGQSQIATNFHVIAGVARGTAKLVNKPTKYTIEGITATDEKNDLAILKVTGLDVQPLSLGDSDTVKIGETVYVAGNPKRLEGTFSDGIISSIRGSASRKLLQMTAPMSPGSSGGPVLNGKGEVIGVSFATIEGGQNLNFAIPSNYLKSLLRQFEPAKPYRQAVQTTADAVELVAAIAHYDKAIRLKPDHADDYVNRGLLKSKLSQYSGAIADYSRAIRLKPNYANAYYYRGKAKHDLEKYSGAIADYSKSIRIKPDYAAAYNNRGKAKADLGEHNAAIADYDKAIRLKPDYVDAYVNRGLAEYDLGQYSAAITDYDAAIRLKPDLAAAYYNRGRAKILLGLTREAKQDLQSAIKLAERGGDGNLKAKSSLVLRPIELKSQRLR
jgi:S1-C subfamily serine protease